MYAYIANTKSKQSTKSAPLSVYAWHAYTRGNGKKNTPVILYYSKATWIMSFESIFFFALWIARSGHDNLVSVAFFSFSFSCSISFLFGFFEPQVEINGKKWAKHNLKAQWINSIKWCMLHVNIKLPLIIAFFQLTYQRISLHLSN